MIDLKLVEYDLDGKFLKFIELTDYDRSTRTSFLYGKDHIVINLRFKVREKGVLSGDNIEFCYFLKDQKDPLNRFNGLFDGRTYGEGKFVLIRETSLATNWSDYHKEPYKKIKPPAIVDYIAQDDIIKFTRGKVDHEELVSYKEWENIFFWNNIKNESNRFGNIEDDFSEWVHKYNFLTKIGNIHENPELYDKIK